MVSATFFNILWSLKSRFLHQPFRFFLTSCFLGGVSLHLKKSHQKASKMVAACVWVRNDRRKRIGFTLRHHVEARTFGLWRLNSRKPPPATGNHLGIIFLDPPGYEILWIPGEIIKVSKIRFASWRSRFGGWDWSDALWVGFNIRSPVHCSVYLILEPTSTWKPHESGVMQRKRHDCSREMKPVSSSQPEI